ncbi:MAG: fatty acid desaturase [Aestuariivirgaceae bacterium]
MASITHRQVIANLDKDQRETLLARSDRAGLIHLAGHIGALLATGLWIALAWPFWQAVLLVHGIVLIFLFTLLHECIHKTPFASQSLNTVIATLCGFILLLPSRWFTYFHLAHHRHTHDPDNDPELAAPKPATWWQYTCYLSGLPVWWSQLRVLLVNATTGPGDGFVPKDKHSQVRREARISVALYCVIAGFSLAVESPLLVWLWLVPAALGQPFLRAYLLAEHTMCPHVTNMLENSRTTFTTRIVRFIAWNMPYHAEHHAYPAVPFHQLPHFHRILQEHLRQTEQGYTAFHRRFVTQLK